MTDLYSPTQDAAALTRLMLESLYCAKDPGPLVAVLDPEVVWTDAAGLARGRDQAAQRIQQQLDRTPRYRLAAESCQTLPLGPDLALVTGQIRLETADGAAVRRVTFLFRRDGEQLLCLHGHLSTTLEAQENLIAQQAAQLDQLRYQDSLTGAGSRTKYLQLAESGWDQTLDCLGVACFELMGRKGTSGLSGRSAGDALIQKMAARLDQQFPHQVYRMDGDGFLVLDGSRDRRAFQAAVQEVQTQLDRLGINCAVGTSWRTAPCSLKAQTDEADSRMNWDKHRRYDEMAGSPYRHQHQD